MPVLDALPHISIIRGLKGILDFYYWKGIPCVRKWPVIPPSSRSPASMDSARLFGAIVAAYSLLGPILKELFGENANDQPRTARDLFVSAVLGHLHDHNMSDFLDLLTEATAYLAILKDLADALQSNDADRLLVRGMDQLLSYDENVGNMNTQLISAADGYTESQTPPEGSAWVIHNISAHNRDSATDRHHYYHITPTDAIELKREDGVFGIRIPTFWQGTVYLENPDVIRVWFHDALATDDCRIALSGYQFTLET